MKTSKFNKSTLITPNHPITIHHSSSTHHKMNQEQNANIPTQKPSDTTKNTPHNIMSMLKPATQSQVLIQPKQEPKPLEQNPYQKPIFRSTEISVNYVLKGTLTGHTRGVSSVKFSLDGKRIASAGK